MSIDAAIFLDRDGVINHNRSDYVKTWEEFRFLPGALDALQTLAALDLPIIVISNQSAIGRGLTARDAVEDVNARMVRAIQLAGGRVDDVLFCPHKPTDNCDCRKPRPGMLLAAAERHGLHLPSCYLVGDAVTDMQVAWAVGARSILVRTGRGSRQVHLLQEADHDRCLVLADLAAAVAYLTEQASRDA